jgi:hypothetical protein
MEIPPEGTKDREVLAIVNTFFMCVSWLSVILNLKAQVEGIDV